MGKPAFLYKTYGSTAAISSHDTVDGTFTNLLAAGSGNDFSNAAWHTAGAGSVTTNSQTDPLGTVTADTLDDTSIATNLFQLAQAIVISVDTVTRVFSVCVKEGTALVTNIELLYTGGTSTSVEAEITWATKTMTNGTLTSLGGGWYQAEVAAANNGTNDIMRPLIYPGGNDPSDVGYIYAWGALLETGSTATRRVTESLDSAQPDILIPTEDTFHNYGITAPYAYVVDLGASATVDYMAMLGENLNGVEIEVRGSTDNFVASDDELSAWATITSAVNAAWRLITSGAYRYYKIRINGQSTALKVANLALDELVQLPYFASDWDASSLEIEASNLVSVSGLFVGVNQQNAMRNLDLDIGEVNASELADIILWTDECIKVSNPFYFVPDVDLLEVFYGWLDNPSFSAPLENALYNVSAMDFVTRAD